MTQTPSSRDATDSWVRADLLLEHDWDTFFVAGLPAPNRQPQPTPGPEKLPPPDDLILDEPLPSPMVSPSPIDSADCSVECMIPLSGVTQDDSQIWDMFY